MFLRSPHLCFSRTTSRDRTIVYATQAGENTFTVIAVDDAGNRSAPASIIIIVSQ